MKQADLIGYLLEALDPDEQRQVDEYLRTYPEAQGELEQLRQALVPLEWDREDPELPVDLRMRTLARVAEHRCREKRRLRPAPPVTRTGFFPTWWRRADVLVAASLLFLCAPMLAAWLVSLRRAHNIEFCQNNLRDLHHSLMVYSDHHNGALPKVEERPPENLAGIFAVLLNQEGVLAANASTQCPANGTAPPRLISADELKNLYETQPEQFRQYAARLGGCYAYTLGYREGGQLVGVRREPNESNDWVPVMADRPPFENQEPTHVIAGNSPNHAGRGQNVLFLGGQVKFCTTRNLGADNDIYLNRDNVVGPGLDRFDAVLTTSSVQLDPEEQP